MISLTVWDNALALPILCIILWNGLTKMWETRNFLWSLDYDAVYSWSSKITLLCFVLWCCVILHLQD